MISNFLNKESETFEKKGWNVGVYTVFAMKLAFSVVSVAYIVLNVQDEIKKIGKYSKEDKNENK